MCQFYVFRAKRLAVGLAFFAVLISLCLLGNSMVTQVIETAASNRLLPIYSVETDQNVVALTFDCAWRCRRYSFYCGNFGSK